MKKFEIACIIDDDPIYVFGAKKVMKNAGFANNILVFQNGREAIDGLTHIVLRQEKLPEIILLDINMPVMDGWEFLDEFKKVYVRQKTTIYIVSSSIDQADLLRAQQYEGVNNYIIKPISVNVLQDILEGLG